MRALILYWSLTGTTRRVAERIAEGLRAECAVCDLYDVREGVPPDTASYDIIGVGFPVHWYRPPSPVSEAIVGLGPLNGRSVFAFSLNGSYRDTALNRARKGLVRAGGKELGTFSSRGEDRFYPYMRLGALFSPGHPDDRELEAARSFGMKMATGQRDIERGQPAPGVPPFDPPAHPMYALERFVCGPRLTRFFYSRFFRADRDRCTRCGKCARECPTHNISWHRGEVPSWGRRCMLCLSCVTNCPEEAVGCPLDWAIFRPFLRWNVNHAWRDPGLDHARVEFRRGRLKRV